MNSTLIFYNLVNSTLIFYNVVNSALIFYNVVNSALHSDVISDALNAVYPLMQNLYNLMEFYILRC